MKSYKVLLDDDHIQRELLLEILNRLTEYFVAIEASNGQDALDLVRTESIDTVLINKRMPNMKSKRSLPPNPY